VDRCGCAEVLVILEVNFYDQLAMRACSTLFRENTLKKSDTLRGRPGKESASSVGRGSDAELWWSGGVATAHKAVDILIIAGQLDINGVDLFTRVNQPF